MSDWNPKVGEIWKWHVGTSTTHPSATFVIKRVGPRPGEARGCSVTYSCVGSDCAGCRILISASMYAAKKWGTGRWEFVGDAFDMWVREVREEAGV